MTLTDRQLYLCPPSFLEMSYEINPWMDKSKSFSQEKALEQWENLVVLYKSLVPNALTIVEPKERLTELCFFGDSVFAIDNKAVFSRFATDERFRETEYVISTLNQKGFKGERVPDHIKFEGSGETMLWNGNILVGYGKRSSAEIVSYLESTFDRNVYGFELIDPKYYHLDTALCPISNDLIMVYEPAFSENSKELIKSLNCEILYLTENDALNFALNSIVIGKNIIIHESATRVHDLLEEKGFIIHKVNISEFIKFGGGIKCLTFQHYLEESV